MYGTERRLANIPMLMETNGGAVSCFREYELARVRGERFSRELDAGIVQGDSSFPVGSLALMRKECKPKSLYIRGGWGRSRSSTRGTGGTAYVVTTASEAVHCYTSVV